MKWKYKCQICDEWRTIDWKKRKDSHKCHKENKSYYPPGPDDQHDAYVDTHNWPEEMEDVVVKIKGKNCTVPGCKEAYETLDHRIPWSKDGRTCVKNLFPMCEEHNLSKGNTPYDLWLLLQDD